MHSSLRIVALAASFLGLGACDRLPRDSQDATDRARAGGMRVGASAEPPFVVVEGERVSGPDAELIQRFAGRQGYKVEWVMGGHDALMTQLEDSRLHAVIGGHSEGSPWEPLVGWSRAVPTRAAGYAGVARRKIALPPGENAWNMSVDRYLSEHERAE